MASESSWLAWVVAAGVGIPVMATASATGARILGSVPLSAALLFALAAIACAVVAMASQPVLEPSQWQRTLAWLAPGSLLIAFYLTTVSAALPRLGVQRTILAVLVAQAVSASAIQHFGLLGSAARPIDGRRLLGIILLIAGFALLNSAPPPRQTPML